jgi:hypothetical protein
MRLQRFQTASYISSSPLIAKTERGVVIAWGGDALHVVSPSGSPLPGWPRQGERFFASSPSLSDVDGDGISELFCGNDDDRLYGWRLDGSSLPGFPIQTGGDVYSSPALADLDSTGIRQILFGSDDGTLYVVNPDGSSFPGWPQLTGHFVAASPAVADLDGDGSLEIVAGSWDQYLYAWKSNGCLMEGWPVRLGHLIWSSATVADIDGDGKGELVVGSDKLHVFRFDGTAQPGFPVPTGSWIVSSPCVADVDLDGRLEIGIGADRFYVFRTDGSLANGFPVDVGGYVWASPIAVDIDGCGHPEWIVASWGGSVHVIRYDGSIIPEYTIQTNGPLYSSPAFFQDDSAFYLAVGSWDRWLYLLTGYADKKLAAPKPMFHGNHLRTGQTAILSGEPFPSYRTPPPDPMGEVTVKAASTLPRQPLPEKITYIDIEVDDPSLLRKAMISYDIAGKQHPSPLVLHRGLLRGMIHPLRPGTSCSWHIELSPWAGSDVRFPHQGEFRFSV